MSHQLWLKPFQWEGPLTGLNDPALNWHGDPA
jgi:hypothetical protein